MTIQQAQSYITRLGLDENLIDHKLDAELLDALQFAHVTTVPYENLDIVNGIPLDLSEDALYDKIVTRHRGGYCFEVNSLYNKLLEALGYKTVSCFARYLRGEGNNIPMHRHRVIIAESDDLDGRYFTDVGIGERAPRSSLKLEEGLVQEQYGETYRFERDGFLGWVLWDCHKGEWGKFMSFTEDPQVDADYIGTSFYCERHPDSPFNKADMLSIKTANGRMTVSDKEFRIFADDKVTAKTMETDEERKEIFERYFGILGI